MFGYEIKDIRKGCASHAQDDVWVQNQSYVKVIRKRMHKMAYKN